MIEGFDDKKNKEDIDYIKEQIAASNWYIEYYSKWDDDESTKLRTVVEEQKKRYERILILLENALIIYQMVRTNIHVDHHTEKLNES